MEGGKIRWKKEKLVQYAMPVHVDVEMIMTIEKATDTETKILMDINKITLVAVDAE